jgi:hypothetical protein
MEFVRGMRTAAAIAVMSAASSADLSLADVATPDLVAQNSKNENGLTSPAWGYNTLAVNTDNFATYPAIAHFSAEGATPFQITALAIETPNSPSATTGFGAMFQILDPEGNPVGLSAINDQTTVTTLLMTDDALFDAFFEQTLVGDIYQSTALLSSDQVCIRSIDDEKGIVQVLVSNEGVRMPSQTPANLSLVLDGLSDGAHAAVLSSDTEGPEGIIVSDDELFITTIDYHFPEEGQTITPAIDMYHGPITPWVTKSTEGRNVEVHFPEYAAGLTLNISSTLTNWNLASDPEDILLTADQNSPVRISTESTPRLFFRLEENLE